MSFLKQIVKLSSSLGINLVMRCLVLILLFVIVVFLSHFESLSFSFVKRTENRAADVIANLAFTSPKVIWGEDFPSGLVSLHHADVLGATLVLTLNKICRWT